MGAPRMKNIADEHFELFKDSDGSLALENMKISTCIFDNCLFSKYTDTGKRSRIENVIASKCKFIGCQIGPGLFSKCLLVDSSASDLVIFWGAIFNEVTLSGRVPPIKINTIINLVPDKNIQSKYDLSRLHHYQSIDWAIDISNARFTVFESRGIPARLFRLDLDTQAVVRRQNLSGLAEISFLETNAWFPWIRSFKNNNGEDLILATPLSKSKKVRDHFLAGLAELRAAGIADPL